MVISELKCGFLGTVNCSEWLIFSILLYLKGSTIFILKRFLILARGLLLLKRSSAEKHSLSIKIQYCPGPNWLKIDSSVTKLVSCDLV